MLRKIVSFVIVAPLAVVLIAFAVANRQLVTLSFDPFDPTSPALGLRLPLFIVIIGVAIIGIVAGSAVTWTRQRHWRRAALRHEAELGRLRSELAAVTGPGIGPAIVPRADAGSYGRLPPAG